jgi:ATP-binding cassette, subfamily B, multidrug efflux pump
MKSLSHLNKYFWKYRWRLILGVVFVAVSNFFAVYSVMFVRDAVDFLKNSTQLPAKTDIANNLVFYALKIVGLAILSGFFLFLMRQTIIVMSRLIEYDLKNEIYNHYQMLDVSFYKRNSTGDLMNRISEDVSRVRMYIGPAIMYIVNTVLTFTLTVSVMIMVDEKLTLYVLLPLPVLAITIYFVSNGINKKSTRVQEQLSVITTKAQEAFSGIRILKAYGREQNLISEMENAGREYKNRTMGLVKMEALFYPFILLMIGLSSLLTVYIGGLQAIHGKISYGNIAEFLVYVNRLTWPIASLGWVTSLIQRAAASQTRINEFLNTASTIENKQNIEMDIKGKIEFKNVSLTYTDSNIRALKNVSFSIESGQMLAIIGHTGSGKSTIANLLCRLFDPTEGKICVDGVPLNDMNLNQLRDSIGYVPQEVFLFSDTIYNNIAFAIDEEKKEESLIITAAKNAAIYDNILQFSEGLQTIVGERGITLSGGQKQRISIARAIIKNPKILLFDDCLSAVDTHTEEEILQNLKRLMLNKTSIIISHRISTVKNADRIIVLNKGELAEQGTHEELLALNGIYAETHRMQLLDEVESI